MAVLMLPPLVADIEHDCNAEMFGSCGGAMGHDCREEKPRQTHRQAHYDAEWDAPVVHEVKSLRGTK